MQNKFLSFSLKLVCYILKVILIKCKCSQVLQDCDKNNKFTFHLINIAFVEYLNDLNYKLAIISVTFNLTSVVKC